MSSGTLRVDGERIVDANGKDVVLRGAGLGGWMNMENFITGYPGHEYQHRAAMLKVLGQEKYDFFFDRWLYYFFTEADAKFYKSLGLNCLRIPFNYRHFEDDMNPRVLKTSGFKHLDRVIELCANEGIYTILDLHAVPGGQNPDWHSDNPTNHAAFWDHKDFQDRAIWLWEQLAARYKGNAWVAGYNPLNEPCDSEHTRLVAWYDRVEPAIRAIDPDHILWLDGNTFASDFSAFTKVLPNCVYALHDYSNMGFPAGERYKGTPEQNEKLERSYLRKAEFMMKYKVPVWNGEFGPVYQPHNAPDETEINEERINLLSQQLKIYDKYKISWSIWLYKDIGIQGMIYTSPTSPWIKTLQPFLEKKKKIQADAWGYHPSAEIDALFKPVVDWVGEVAPDTAKRYPYPLWDMKRQVSRQIQQCLISEMLSVEFARYFEGMSFEELEAMAKSFAFGQCVQRASLNKALRDHAGL
ncbi:putative glucanase [Sphaerosporella brunnea]|uniref:Putative glucanase n=1 Tax=Sphaerosporella brunnea TaxID=1250544 RepID=A0A5J5F8I5_9PEZI|nr:putative glucanase [Sphaerosporella brunnea]